ncbi:MULTISPECIES: S10 family serine carboxypeptidase-like protein [Jonquetella]|uniref:Carboxypeptidase C (Cathepsin A) n=1 Tax=Jonquetella anthropi DSM 22815 TaxID=885272 RepID=H0UKZ9_9BACT|nr:MULTISPECIES: septum formation initiator [Jonquetella]EEX47918.1 serine carboxypeptidase [Jonquetella anthropi E3_33 E1]EHM13358.1 carboxypeptidase C (cathepsin A) [Jonquetella anthropi DSM 22815]ERL24913.1 serine carboxypeptidase domain protein [Jonquetella sp. BV3C21]
MEDIRVGEEGAFQARQPESSFDDSIELDGERLDYTCTVGQLPLYGDQDDQRCEWFYAAYTKKNLSELERACRPVTFAFNGCPGTSSIYLHVGGLAPKALCQSDHGLDVPRPPFRLEDNPGTILDFTDLVFIDPLGTGFSRGAGWDKDLLKRYCGVDEDAEAFSEFIRVWLTKQRRWADPVVVFGESYGGVRGGRLLTKLQDRGIMPEAFVALSPAFSYAELNTTALLERHLVHTLPAMAVCAWYHKKLSSRLQALTVDQLREEVGNWAKSEYVPLLWKGVNCLTEKERADCAAKLAEYTGLTVAQVEDMNLKVLHSRFAGLLLADEGKAVSLFDSRLTVPEHGYKGDTEPSSFRVSYPALAALHDYFGDRLPAGPEREYYLFNDAYVAPAWNFFSGYETKLEGIPTRAGGFISSLEQIALAMKRFPDMGLFVGCGYFDIHCSIDTTQYCLNHLPIPRELMGQITLRRYWGGHMLYTNMDARLELRRDLKEFYSRTLAR